jgi:hypothetical protein
MTTTDEMAQLVSLWALISEVQLTDQEDAITWRWTRHGEYSAKSAYTAQFSGSCCTFDSMAIWRARTEGKHRFFAWLLVQRKILTADKLLARNWPCDPICLLCNQQPVTAEHLCLHCIFAQEVWLLVAQWSQGLVCITDRCISMQAWWNEAVSGVSGKEKIKKASTIIYTAWNLWKERNRRVFEKKTATPRRVVELIKEEIAFRVAACGAAQEPAGLLLL